MNIGNISHATGFHPLAKMSIAATAETTQKVAAFSNTTFMKAAFIARFTLSTTFSAIANFISSAATQIKTIASAVFGFAKSAISVIKPICEKITQVSIAAFQKMAPYLAIGWAYLKIGAAKGFEWAKEFCIAHPQGTLIAGASVIGGLAVISAIRHAVHSRQKVQLA
jgi:hypothetical protein